MPYQNLPSYGRRVRPQPLNVVYSGNQQPRRSSPAPRARSYYTPRRTITPTRNSFNPTFAQNVQPVQKSRKLSFSFKKPALAFVALGLIVFTIFHGFSGTRNVAQAITSAEPITEVKQMIDPAAAAAAKASAEQEARLSTYQKTVNDIIAAHPEETIAVSSADVSSDSATTSLVLGDQGTFTGASTAKLITAITLLHQIEQGKLTMNTKVEGQKVSVLLQKMVVNSDNTAWESLNNYLTHATMKTYMTQLGMTEYDPDPNTLLPSDMTLLMKKFYNQQILTKPNTDLLLSYMQQANKREYIVADVPEGYTVYHKAGWLDGLMHDVAIISNGQKTIVLSIYTYSGSKLGDNQSNQGVFKQITQAALQAYFD
jgi:beta-lactamase class A